MKQSNIEDFSSILRQLIESTGLSIYEISRATKISYQAIVAVYAGVCINCGAKMDGDMENYRSAEVIR